MSRYRIIHQQANIEIPQGAFHIGRSLDCNLVLDDPSVSRIHATIYLEGDYLYVEDRGSRNGCLRNGAPISGKVRLWDGDVLRIGHQDIRIQEVPDSRPAASAKATMGLVRCPSCGAWHSQSEPCPNCGAAASQADTREDETAVTTEFHTHSAAAMLGLAHKALGRGNTAEATRLVRLAADVLRRNLPAPPSEDDAGAMADLYIDLAATTGTAALLSELFAVCADLGVLIPRAAVDRLYSVVRRIDYRTCSDLRAYAEELRRAESTFSAGEKFTARRIVNLVSLCS